jgi:hypothetical protein
MFKKVIVYSEDFKQELKIPFTCSPEANKFHHAIDQNLR